MSISNSSRSAWHPYSSCLRCCLASHSEWIRGGRSSARMHYSCIHCLRILQNYYLLCSPDFSLLNIGCWRDRGQHFASRSGGSHPGIFLFGLAFDAAAKPRYQEIYSRRATCSCSPSAACFGLDNFGFCWHRVAKVDFCCCAGLASAYSISDGQQPIYWGPTQ